MTKTLTKYWFLEDFDLFKKLGMELLMEVSEKLVMKRYSKGTRIELNSSKDQSVFFLKKGSVKIFNPNNGMVKFILEPGNIFGELSLYQEPNEVTEAAYTLEDSLVCVFSAAQMNTLMEEHKALNNSMLKIYGFRFQRLERKLEDLVYKDSPTRIKEFIYDHIKTFGSVVGDRMEAKRLLSHKDIAHLTNTSRQTVNNVMVTLRQEGVIDYNAKFISMLNLNKQS